MLHSACRAWPPRSLAGTIRRRSPCLRRPCPCPSPTRVLSPNLSPKPQGSSRPAASRPAATPSRPVTRTYRPARGDRRAPHSSFPPGNQEESDRQETQGEGKAEARGGDEAAARARGKGRAEDPLRCRGSRFESRRGFPPDQHAANRSTRGRGVGSSGSSLSFSCLSRLREPPLQFGDASDWLSRECAADSLARAR